MRISIGELNDKIMREAPRVSEEFLTGIAPNRSARMEEGREWFTGFKGHMPDVYLFDDPNRIVDVDPSAINYVGQWVFLLDKTTMAYVNMPGMERGTIKAGATFDIGDLRLTRDSERHEIEKAVFEGHQKLMELVEQERRAA